MRYVYAVIDNDNGFSVAEKATHEEAAIECEKLNLLYGSKDRFTLDYYKTIDLEDYF